MDIWDCSKKSVIYEVHYIRIIGTEFTGRNKTGPLNVCLPVARQYTTTQLPTPPLFLSSLWGDVAISTEASNGPNAQPHIPNGLKSLRGFCKPQKSTPVHLT